ncbi:MAG TPA: cyclic nucleotide-binding domain-containing protein [Mycobacteriales bacterium]|nr:cyclic nucleotide-binding domain-containing protein [Mycobacteriales bacterium]
MSRQPSDDLRKLPVFANLHKKELEQADSLLTPVTFKAGDMLCVEGNFGLQVFIMITGTAKVTKHGEDIATVGPGDLVGEMALLDMSERSASVTALEPVTALVASAHEFASLRRIPGVDAAIRAIAASRSADSVGTTN